MKQLLFLLLFASSAFAQAFEVLPDIAIKGVTTTIRLRRPPIFHHATSVTVAGVPAQFTFANLSSDIDVTLPDLPAGTVADIVVTQHEGPVLRRTAALRIVDPNVPYSPNLFDRILIPVIYNGPGQKGSRWATDLWMMNGSNYSVPFLRGAVPQLDAEQIASVVVDAPNGHILYPVRGTTDELSINVLARDLSRQSEALGTEIPVVRERDFENRRILLMNIPSDPAFRVTLRAYALDELPLDGRMNYWIYDLETGAQVAFGILRLEPPANEQTPWSGTIGDLLAVHPEIANKGRLRLSISPLRADTGARFWAFISVTNNETQHVTVISPNP
jgi:hypothetical protein